MVALLFSLLFYSWGEGVYVVLLLATVLINYLMGRAITSTDKRKLALSLGVGINLTLLAYYKYFGFLINDVLMLEGTELDTPHLPLGISFFIFQSISYLVDVYRKDAKEAESFSDLALYISMFPQLIAGPIVRYSAVSEAITQRRITFSDTLAGMSLFVLGLSQKMLIANNVAEVADHVYALDLTAVKTLTAWVGSTAYTLQIYFDFCGYSLMAMGIGRIMGFSFPRNFNYPYVSQSITEFWRRWHMSLSSWFRDYLYIPLGGNRKGPVRTYLNLFIVFFLCGLWHGASWTFVAWGIFHGMVLIIERAGLSFILQKVPRIFSHSYTLILVIIGWVLFRAENFSQVEHFLGVMFFPTVSMPAVTLSSLVGTENAVAMALGVVFSLPVLPWVLDKFTADRTVWSGAQLLTGGLVLLSMFLMCTTYIMAGTYNPFIYFRF